MMSNVTYIQTVKQNRNTAGMKAPDDVSEICRRLGMKQFKMPMFPSNSPLLYQKIWLLLVTSFYWIKLERRINKNEIILYQHPMYGNRVSAYFIPRIKKRKSCQFVAVIHDLESLRKGIDGVIKNSEKRNEIADSVILQYMDKIICHNEHMRQYLIEQGFAPESLVNLEIFDYLTDGNYKNHTKTSAPSIAIAGNLAVGKCAYIYNIYGKDGTKNGDLHIHLYGNNYDETSAKGRMIYHGSFPPDELPNHLEGDFGLVWDGISAETCAGNTGEYLKYNNPHKTSLYLASGMPVIVWREAAIADFVLDHGVGIVVDSLYNLSDTIKNVSDKEYEEMCQNTRKIGKKLRDGYFLKKALKQCLDE